MNPLRPQLLDTSFTLGPGFAITIVIAMGVYSWLDGELYRSAAESADQSRAAVQLIEKMLSLLADAESGQRGFLLTGDTRDLTRYTTTVPQIQEVEAAIRESGKANPEEAARLSDLVSAQLGLMERTVELRIAGAMEAALEPLRSDQGARTTDQIRGLAALLEAEENARYAELTASAAHHGYKTRVLILVGAFLLAGLLWVSNRRVSQLLAAQRVLIGDLDRSMDQEARGKAALDTILRSIGDAVIATDASGRIRFINGVAAQLTGWTSAEAEDRTLGEVFQVVDELTRAPAPDISGAVLAGSRIIEQPGGFLLQARDGREVPVEYSGAPLQHGDAAPTGVAIVFRDVTERRHLEDQLRQAQKLEAVGQLAGGIAHDFNNLLTVIQGYAEMMHTEAPPESAQREPTREILVSAQRAAALTRQLLAFSRRQVLQPLRLNLNDNVSNTHRMLERLLGEDIQFSARPGADLWDVMADPGQIDQIIMNLAVNARDAMPHGGTLSIETANLELNAPDPVHYPEMAPGRYVLLALRDSGQGMDARVMSRIFEPFFTTKEVGRGTGLGLSTVYGIVKQSGGHIQVESEPGMGALFRIYLPAAGEAPAIAARPAAKAAASSPVETILVVEDDQRVRTLVTSMLTSLGYRVLSPGTPQEAIGICADRRIELDLVLTDMVLPHTDGIAIAQQATAIRPELKVLFMSGYTDHPVLQRPGVEAQAFLHKPFTKAALAAKVREVLGRES